MTQDHEERTSRRGFLSAVAATGGVLGIGGTVYAQQQGQGVATSYVLGGRIGGWQGRAPPRIDGAVNPTLNLTPGKKYEVTWENVDGAPHNFAILGPNGNVLLRTDIISQAGATQTITFTATEQMDTYLCQVHPTTMFGQIALGGGEATQPGNKTQMGNQTPAQNATPTETPTTNVSDPSEEPDPSTPGPLGESAKQFIARLEPKKGIQSDATGTTYFTLHPPDGVQAKLLFHITLDNIPLKNVTAAHIHLNRKQGNPIVASLYTPQSMAMQGNRTAGMNMTGNQTMKMNMTVTTNATRTPATSVPLSRARTLTHDLLTAQDLVGPFKDAKSLTKLVEAIHNDTVFVMVHTEQHPGGLLRGPIQAVGVGTDKNGNNSTPACSMEQFGF